MQVIKRERKRETDGQDRILSCPSAGSRMEIESSLTDHRGYVDQ